MAAEHETVAIDASRPYTTLAVQGTVIAAVLASQLLPWYWKSFPLEWEGGAAFVLLALVAVLVLRNGDTTSLGFRSVPLQGWCYWFRLAGWFGLCVGVLVLVFYAGAWMLDWKIPIPRTKPEFLVPKILFMCVYAPLVEELLYRSLFATAFLRTLGQTGTIIASGIVFAAIHWNCGVASPENQVGGFLLAWAFLRSGTILVPLAMHSAGNLMAVVAQVVNWYWLP